MFNSSERYLVIWGMSTNWTAGSSRPRSK